MGQIIHFSLEAFNQSMEFTHQTGIENIYLDSNGTQLSFIDNKSNAYVYQIINENIKMIPNCPDNIEGIIWDENITERSIFAVYNKTIIVTYIFVQYFIKGDLLIIYCIPNKF